MPNRERRKSGIESPTFGRDDVDGAHDEGDDNYDDDDDNDDDDYPGDLESEMKASRSTVKMCPSRTRTQDNVLGVLFLGVRLFFLHFRICRSRICI